VKQVLTIATLALALGCASGRNQGNLTVGKLSDILGVTVWRIPAPATGAEWTIDVQVASPAAVPRKTLSTVHSEPLTATVALRENGRDEVEFTLLQKGSKSSGTMTPCAEPEGSESMCDGYGTEIVKDPLCLPGCEAFVIAELRPMIGTGIGKQVVIREVPTLTVVPGKGRLVVPIPRQ
jgi:hypothetical protein